MFRSSFVRPSRGNVDFFGNTGIPCSLPWGLQCARFRGRKSPFSEIYKYFRSFSISLLYSGNSNVRTPTLVFVRKIFSPLIQPFVMQLPLQALIIDDAPCVFRRLILTIFENPICNRVPPAPLWTDDYEEDSAHMYGSRRTAARSWWGQAKTSSIAWACASHSFKIFT